MRDHTRVNLHLSRATHARLKAWCQQNGCTIQGKIRAMVEGLVGSGAPLGQLAARPMHPAMESWMRPAEPAYDARRDGLPRPPPKKPESEPRPGTNAVMDMIPEHWLNKYGKTIGEQFGLDNDLMLQYWPPDHAERPTPVPYVEEMG